MKKKLFLILLIAVFITAFAYSQKITVTNPHSGAKWYKGQTYTITWTKSGQMDTKVKIRLFQGGRKILNITNNTANNGSYTWKVPTTLADGNYIIRVKTVDNHVFDDSDIFTISKSSSKFGTINDYRDSIKGKNSTDIINKHMLFPIKIVSPTGGNWKEGSTMTIKWEGKSGETFGIYLVSFDKKEVEKVIKGGIAELLPFGSKAKYLTYNWTIPNKLFGDITKYIGDHRIKIVRKKDGAVGYSEPFHIFASLKTQKYKIHAKTKNYYHWKDKKKSSIIGGAPFVLGFKYEDPGNGKLRVGYANSYTEDSVTYHYYGKIYRAHAFFDVSKLKGKGLITKANLHYHHYKGGSCGLRVYEVTKPFSDIFKASINLIENPQGNWASLVRKWVRDPSSNHGIIFTGTDESFSHNNKKCVDYYDNVYLEIEVTER